MRMRNIIYIIVCLIAFGSCARYDDSPLWEKFQEHEERIAKLEAACKEMNSNITALQTIVAALQGYDYVTKVTDLIEDGKVIGYVITFSKSGPVTIYHGQDGAEGAPGQDGIDGKDGHTPVIGVRQDEDGVYYWTLDGEWLLDAEGQKIPTTGKDGEPGQDGADGAPGQDAVTPQLKIEEGWWYISYNGGESWTKLGKATGEDGQNGAPGQDGAQGVPGQDGTPGQDGADGKDGKDGDSFFQSVETTDDYIILTLADGTQIKVPTWKAFEELQTAINKLNTTLSALQAIVEAIQNNDFVTSIVPVIENGEETGYTISFSKSLPVTIFHGRDGKDGADGEDGKDGIDGVDGKDGHTPVIGVKQDTDGVYYWTLDGEWLLGASGEKIPTTGKDGEPGQDGTDGKDGITPVLKITDGYWYISYDGGKTWETEPLGPATGGKTEGPVEEITYDESYVYIKLSDEVTITLPRTKEAASVCIFNPIDIEENSATFSGRLNVPAEDLGFCQVTLYYSRAEKFNIHSASSMSTYKFDDNQNFKFTLSDLNPGTKYTYCLLATIKNEKVYSAISTFEIAAAVSDPVDFDFATATDLTKYSNANCYIISEPGTYKFITLKGNSEMTVGNVASSEILWESFGTATAPAMNELISKACYQNGYIGFEVPEDYKEGNAVIAARDAEGTILWSWHIWLTDQPAEQVYYNDAGTMMDRNLGATSATPGDVGALGLMYQWGRKDPFLGASSILWNNIAKSTITWPSVLKSDSLIGTIEYAIAHPTTFIIANEMNLDWNYTDSPSIDETRWTRLDSPKSVYDPCPSGWRVPDGGQDGLWGRAYGPAKEITGTYDTENQGINYSSLLGDDDIIWYPASGMRRYEDGRLYLTGTNGYYWSSTNSGIYAYGFYIKESGRTHHGSSQHGRGLPVRCIKETTNTPGNN